MEAQPSPAADARLRRIPLVYRHDGFSPFFRKGPMTPDDLRRVFVDPLAGTNVEILEWGVGPGSVFCYETKVGEVYGEGLTEEQRKLLRTLDLAVHENVMGLIRTGKGPMRLAVERAHERGLELFARLEMNHEYGPADPKNWMWVGFVGSLNKRHPEYRIGKSVALDFKHPEVRDFKRAILREVAELGADGVSMDFVVYPPYFAKPDAAIMTRFVRDVRDDMDAIGRRQGRRIRIMARVPYVQAPELGLDWRAWMREHLVDIVVPSHLRPADVFDIRIEEFVALGRETGIPVIPTLWQALGFVDGDERPEDEKSGRRRYDKPKTREIFCAQALLFHRAGADGLQLGFAADEWNGRPWLNDLADPEKLLYADKQYMVDPVALRPGTFSLPKEPPFAAERAVPLRIADDILAAQAAGHRVKTTLILTMRPLHAGEKLELFVNGHGPASLSGDDPAERARAGEQAVDPRGQPHESFIFDQDWWKRGAHPLAIPPGWWRLGANELHLVYSSREPASDPPLSLTWIDLMIHYQAQGGAANQSKE